MFSLVKGNLVSRGLAADMAVFNAGFINVTYYQASNLLTDIYSIFCSIETHTNVHTRTQMHTHKKTQDSSECQLNPLICEGDGGKNSTAV